MSDKRAFEGVWIPAEMWLSKDLSLQEKVMLVEIKSLSVDPARGCYKSNKAFAEFFNLSASRVSEIISGLEKKGYLKIVQKRDGKRIVERNIFIAKRYSESRRGYSENGENPIRDSEGGYSENTEESNTPKSSTGESIHTGVSPEFESVESEFDHLWSIYPKRAGGNPKADALKAYRSLRKSHPFGPIRSGLVRYAHYCSETGATETQYVKQAKTFFGPGLHWQDEFPLPQKANQGGNHENRNGSSGNSLQQAHDEINDAFHRAQARNTAADTVEANDPAVRPQVEISAPAVRQA